MSQLLKSTRQHYHQRIAQVLEAQFPETAEAQPELLAHHYTEAGLKASAIAVLAPSWSASHPAFGLCRSHQSPHQRGLELPGAIPDTPTRIQHELVLQILLGPALMADKGTSGLRGRTGLHPGT